jgi:SH3 domain
MTEVKLRRQKPNLRPNLSEIYKRPLSEHNEKVIFYEPFFREEPVAEPAYNGESDGEKYIACYPYQSAEAGDLQFEAGEDVLVVKKDGDWWTGVIGNRTGIFPANYVQPADNNTSVTNGTISNNFNSMNINGSSTDQTSNIMSAEEARNQADADSEVSQINTQNVSNDVNMQEFRGMTASAVIIPPRSMVKISYSFSISRAFERRKVRWPRL